MKGAMNFMLLRLVVRANWWRMFTSPNLPSSLEDAKTHCEEASSWKKRRHKEEDKRWRNMTIQKFAAKHKTKTHSKHMQWIYSVQIAKEKSGALLE